MQRRSGVHPPTLAHLHLLDTNERTVHNSLRTLTIRQAASWRGQGTVPEARIAAAHALSLCCMPTDAAQTQRDPIARSPRPPRASRPFFWCCHCMHLPLRVCLSKSCKKLSCRVQALGRPEPAKTTARSSPQGGAGAGGYEDTRISLNAPVPPCAPPRPIFLASPACMPRPPSPVSTHGPPPPLVPSQSLAMIRITHNPLSQWRLQQGSRAQRQRNSQEDNSPGQ